MKGVTPYFFAENDFNLKVSERRGEERREEKRGFVTLRR